MTRSPNGTQFGEEQAAHCSMQLRQPAGMRATELKLPKQVSIHRARSHQIMCSVQLSSSSLQLQSGSKLVKRSGSTRAHCWKIAPDTPAGTTHRHPAQMMAAELMQTDATASHILIVRLIYVPFASLASSSRAFCTLKIITPSAQRKSTLAGDRTSH